MPAKELPLVSIITPSYNQGNYIEETIKSVLTQDYPHLEYIIVDGGSTDNTLDIIKKYEDRISWISEPDNGQADAINKGFKMSRGEIVAWLNSDDTYCQGTVMTAVENLLLNSDIAMIYGDGYEIDDLGRVIKKFPATQRFDLWKLIYIWDYILQPTVFMRKDALLEVGLLDTTMNWCMDWDLWIRFGKRYRVVYVPGLFANSRVYSSTKTSSGGGKRFKEIVRVMRKHGNKRFPPGFFIYGQDTLENIIMARFPRLYRLLLKYPLHGLRYLFGKMIHGSQGVFFDNWVTGRAYFTVPVLLGDTLIIKGTAQPYDGMLPLKIAIEINKRERCKWVIEKKGLFCIKCTLSHSERDLLDIVIRSNKTFRPCDVSESNDKRIFSFLLKDIYVTKT